MTLTPAQLRQVREIADRSASRALGGYATKSELNSVALSAGAVSSVNGQAGAVVLTTANVSESGSNLYVSSSQKSKLDAIVYKFTEVYTYPGTVATGTGSARLYFSNTATITNVAIWVSTAPTGASLIVDVNKNGVSIFSTRPTITAGTFSDLTTTPTTTAMASGDYLTVDVDQVGSTVPGSNLAVRIEWTETVA